MVDAYRYRIIVKHLLETVLGEAAGVAEVAGFGFPVLEAAVVKGLQIVCDDEGDDTAAQAFLEQQQAADAAVAVLEGVDALEAVVKVQQIVKGLFFLGVVIPQQGLHGGGDGLRGGGGAAADLVGKTFIVTHGKPILAAVRGAVFQHCVELLDQAFGDGVIGCVDDQVDAAEVVGGLHHVVHPHRLLGPDGVGLKNQPGLVVGQAAALHVVGVVGQVNLDLVINAAVELCRLLFPQNRQQIPPPGVASRLPGGLFGVLRHVPGLPCEQGTRNPPLGAVIPHAALGKTPTLCCLRNRNIVHMKHLRNTLPAILYQVIGKISIIIPN